MRKITEKVVAAFLAGKSCKCGNSSTNGKHYLLHGNIIAFKGRDGALYVTSAGWNTNTTKERLNALPGVSIAQKDFCWFLNGVEWDGSLAKIP